MQSGLVDGRLGHLALADRHSMHGHLWYAVIVYQSASQDEHVKDLVGMEPDVTLSRKPPNEEISVASE